MVWLPNSFPLADLPKIRMRVALAEILLLYCSDCRPLLAHQRFCCYFLLRHLRLLLLLNLRVLEGRLHFLMNARVSFESYRYIMVHGSCLNHTAVPVPLLPLGDSYEIDHVRPIRGAVTNCGLLVVRIQQKPYLVFLDILGLSDEVRSEGEEVSQCILGDVWWPSTLIILFSLC